MSKRTSKTVTRAALVRAFTSPGRSRSQTNAIVARYIGNNPVPPVWSLASVRGVFGTAVARSWAKKIRHLRLATYRDPETTRWLIPVVQTAYDFGTSPEALASTAAVIGELEALFRAGKGPYGQSKAHVPFVADEFHQAFASA